jgi:hypothetical protein
MRSNTIYNDCSKIIENTKIRTVNFKKFKANLNSSEKSKKSKSKQNTSHRSIYTDKLNNSLIDDDSKIHLKENKTLSLFHNDAYGKNDKSNSLSILNKANLNENIKELDDRKKLDCRKLVKKPKFVRNIY